MNQGEKSLSQQVEIVNELGLHARSAGKIAALAAGAAHAVWLVHDGNRADAKSILDMLSLGCSQGSKVTVEIENPSDQDILTAIATLIVAGFEEE